MRIVFSLLMLACGSVFAQAVTTNLDEMRAKGLAPHELQAINAIGANILQAKVMGRTQTDPNDKDLLNQLRNSVSNLIAIEFQAKANIQASSVSQAATVTNNQQSTSDVAHKAAQTAAWDVVGKLHQESGQLQSSTTSKTKREIVSGGMPIGEQRGHQYEEWAKQLEVVINNKNSQERISQLLALQSQLQPQQGGITVPLAPATPTLQSVTWDTPPAETGQPATDSGKKHKKH